MIRRPPRSTRNWHTLSLHDALPIGSASPISSLRHDRNQRFVGALLLLGIAVSMDWIINIAIGTLAVIGRHARAVHGPTVPVAFYQIGIGDECLTKSHHVRAVLLDGACRRRPIEAAVIDHRSVEQRDRKSTRLNSSHECAARMQ